VGTATGTWPGEQGFQDGTDDTSTGLVNMGAREYDTGTASFVSPDPLLEPTNPQDLNPYAYAGDSAPSAEDPSGAIMIQAGDGCTGSMQAVESCVSKRDAGGSSSTTPACPIYLLSCSAPGVSPAPSGGSGGGGCPIYELSCSALGVSPAPSGGGKSPSGVSDQAGSSSGPAVVHTQPAPKQVTHAQSCGFLGLSCVAHAVSHAASDVGEWVNDNSEWLGVAELVLGVAGLVATGPL
jgi:RHS repeat-associated protein